TYLGPTGSQMGKKESAKDTARVLGGMYDGIEYRGFSQRIVEDLAKYSGVPVWNGLTDEDHPTQVLADFLTAKEVLKKPYHEINFTYVGDGRNNVANALMQGAAIMGMTFHLVCPKELNPTDELLNRCKEIAAKNGGEILVTDDIDEGVKGSDVIYTDVWVSMGEPDEVWEKRIKLLEPYRVTKEMMEKTGNPHTIFEHCLPSFHDTETTIGKQIQEKYSLTEMEVSNEVFESEQSVVFQEAENRAHTIKAVMVATLGE
ncbi:ornithine carbamoyltransferase, partial [Staphylococcus devriesei]